MKKETSNVQRPTSNVQFGIGIVFAIALAMTSCHAPHDPADNRQSAAGEQDQVKELVAAGIREMLATGLSQTPIPTPAPTLTPLPFLLDNPWETDEERALRARKRGFAFASPNGEPWAYLRRKDGEDVTRGMGPRDVKIESDFEPYVVRDPETAKWIVAFTDNNTNKPNKPKDQMEKTSTERTETVRAPGPVPDTVPSATPATPGEPAQPTSPASPAAPAAPANPNPTTEGHGKAEAPAQ